MTLRTLKSIATSIHSTCFPTSCFVARHKIPLNDTTVVYNTLSEVSIRRSKMNLHSKLDPNTECRQLRSRT
jgi:hypothetical protein